MKIGVERTSYNRIEEIDEGPWLGDQPPGTIARLASPTPDVKEQRWDKPFIVTDQDAVDDGIHVGILVVFLETGHRVMFSSSLKVRVLAGATIEISRFSKGKPE